MATRKVILRLLRLLGRRVHRTKLVKLVYLADYLWYRHYGATLTGLKYMWDQYGPNAVGNAIVFELDKLARNGTVHIFPGTSVYGGPRYVYHLPDSVRVAQLGPEAEAMLHDVVRTYGSMGVRDIVSASKKTEPFRRAKQYDVLTMERVSERQLSTTPEDVAAYEREVTGLGPSGGKTLEQIRSKYGLG